MKDMDNDLQIDIHENVYQFSRSSLLVGSRGGNKENPKNNFPLEDQSSNSTPMFELVNEKKIGKFCAC